MSTMVQPRQMIRPWQAVRQRVAAPMWTTLVGWTLQIPLLYYALHGGMPWVGVGAESGGGFITAEADSGSQLSNRLIMLFIFSLAGALMLPGARRLIEFARRNMIHLALPTLALLSAAWSQYPSTTLMHGGLALAVMTLMAFYFVQRFTPEQQMQSLAILSLIVSISSFAFAALLPQYGLDMTSSHFGALQGIFHQKNSAARTMIFLLPAIVCWHPRESFARLVRTSALALNLLMIAATQSRTGWLLAFVVLANLTALKIFGRFRRRDATILLSSGLIALAGAAAVLAVDWKNILMSMGRDVTLTGRVPLWAAVMESIAKKPLLGWGYAAFWMGMKGESLLVVLKTHWAVPYAHDGFLDVWLQLGFVGLVILVFIYLKAWKDGYSCFWPNRNSAIDWHLTILLLTLLYNLDEGTFIAPNEIAWFLFVVAALTLGTQARELQLKKKRARLQVGARELVPAR